MIHCIRKEKLFERKLMTFWLLKIVQVCSHGEMVWPHGKLRRNLSNHQFKYKHNTGNIGNVMTDNIMSDSHPGDI